MKIANIEDLRVAARRRVPRIFFDYLDGGAFSETTMHANIADFDKVHLEQRVLVNIEKRNLATRFLGSDYAMPLMLAPTGFAGMLAHRGEVQAGRAAKAAGIPLCLSTTSICSMEEVRRDSDVDFHFQLYVFKDRGLAELMLERAVKAQAKSLFVTVDATIGGRREKDLRNGFRTSRRPTPGALLDMMTRVRWGLDMLRGPWPLFGNFTDVPGAGKDIMAQALFVGRQLDPTLTWADLAWMRKHWKGPMVIKGILSVEDAQRAVDQGADGIVVSNHGGRQLDGARSSIAVLPEIAKAVGHKTEVLFDGGIRRGSHIVKALALGARACLIGRTYLYGLGAGGQAGVTRALDLLRFEMDVTMALMGVTDVDQLRDDGARYIRNAA